ncbi:MAG TPA: hypothetical protein VM432_06000 [Bdellovibrionales bacterium]|nr:hypothetical protein [Bdellovibrionales bacterium]
MTHTHGEVTVNDLPNKSRLFKFCEKKIDQWLQNLGSSTDEPIEFKVEFTEEEDTRQVSCVTEIHVGQSVWRGFDLSTDEQQAFMHSLKRLQPH